jgi:hypothetical protein
MRAGGGQKLHLPYRACIRTRDERALATERIKDGKPRKRLHAWRFGFKRDAAGHSHADLLDAGFFYHNSQFIAAYNYIKQLYL